MAAEIIIITCKLLFETLATSTHYALILNGSQYVYLSSQ